MSEPLSRAELEDRLADAVADMISTGKTVIETANLRTHVTWVDGAFQVIVEARDD